MHLGNYTVLRHRETTVFGHQGFCGRWAVGGHRVNFSWVRRWRETVERGRVGVGKKQNKGNPSPKQNKNPEEDIKHVQPSPSLLLAC